MGEEAQPPAQLLTAIPDGALLFKGPAPAHGVYDVVSIFREAHVRVPNTEGGLRETLHALLDPADRRGTFALLSSNPGLIVIPQEMARHAATIHQLLGFTFVTGATPSLHERFEQLRQALIQA